MFDHLRLKTFFIPEAMRLLMQSKKIDERMNPDIYKEYADFLLENKLATQSETGTDLKLKGAYKPEFAYPSKISNCIFINPGLDIFRMSFINKLNISAIFLIFERETLQEELCAILQEIDQTGITHIEMVLNHDSVALEKLLETVGRNKRIVRIFCPGSIDEVIQAEGMQKIIRTVRRVEYCCDINSSALCYSNLHFTESQHHNTCLNRKLCIDKDGYIKNCPYMNHHFGHISNTNIEEVVQLPEFQQWWHIKKDEIDVCKDCEFRHMCTDCRALIKDPGNVYSQPSKCTYNPYICKWASEEGYVPVEECGTYSRESGFVPNKKKIRALNKAIWGDE